LSNDLKEGNKITKWMEREPYAYWKGNPSVAATRQDLMKCHASETQDWNARVYAQVTTSPVDPVWTIPASHNPAGLVGVCAMHGPDGAVATSVAAPSSPPR